MSDIKCFKTIDCNWSGKVNQLRYRFKKKTSSVEEGVCPNCSFNNFILISDECITIKYLKYPSGEVIPKKSIISRVNSASQPLKVKESAGSRTDTQNEIDTTTEEDETFDIDEAVSELKPFAFDSLESVRKKLLNLTSRNKLLHYNHPKASCVRLVDELPDQVFSELNSQKSLNFIPVPEPTEAQLIDGGFLIVDEETGEKEGDFPSAEQWARHLGFATSYNLPECSISSENKKHHNDNNLQTLLYTSSLEASLRSIRSKAETAIEESGANILYLTIGFLEWIESRDSEIKRMAPLFSVPVKLERSQKAGRDGTFSYFITLKDDGIMTNVALREKLTNDFALGLPEIEEDMLPEEYFDAVKKTILKSKPRWNIRRQASLVMLDFTKQAMYSDLDPSNWPENAKIENHPIISKFFSSGKEEDGKENFGYENEHLIDTINTIHTNFPIVYDADSSQHSALIDAVEGQNLVIEGPPGTGKSQTITNLIAASIANGKRVLFVAEKMAALNVVKDRLDRAGLGDFCLELHSHKTNKQKILGDLDFRLKNQKKYRFPKEIETDIARFEKTKDKLLNYAEKINSHWKNTGITLHEIFSKATRYREFYKLDPTQFKVDNSNGDVLGVLRRKEIEDRVKTLSKVYDQISEQSKAGDIENHYWFGIQNADLHGFQTKQLCKSLASWNDELIELYSYFEKLTESMRLSGCDNLTLEGIWSVIESIEKLPSLAGEEPFELLENLQSNQKKCERIFAIYEGIHNRNKTLVETLKKEVLLKESTESALVEALKFFKLAGCPKELTLESLGLQRISAGAFLEEVETLIKDFEQFRPSLSSDLNSCFSITRKGLAEFKTFMALAMSLPRDLWKHRDELYDNPDLDSLLEKLTISLKSLLPVHEKLKSHFLLDELPSLPKLRRNEEILASGGFFKWFSSDWRKARKETLALSSKAKPKATELFSLMPDLITYAQGIEDIDTINKENDVLDDKYAGVQTPIDRIVQLRSWYKAIRKEYGIGFGDRVFIGSALLKIDRTFMSELLDFVEKGLNDKLVSITEGVKKLSVDFPSFKPIANQDQDLSVSLSSLHKNLEESLEPLETIVTSSSHSLASLNQAGELIQDQQKDLLKWYQNPLATKLEESMQLKLEAESFSAVSLQSGRNIIQIIRAIQNVPHFKNSRLSSIDKESYINFRKSSADLRSFKEKHEEASKAFCNQGQTLYEQWSKAGEGGLSCLIKRNESALNNPNWLSSWVDYLNLKIKLSTDGLDKIVTELEAGTIKSSDLIGIMNMAIYHQLTQEIFSEDKSIKSFNGMEQMAVREQFQKYDRKLMELQREMVSFKAAQTEAPKGVSSGRVGEYTEMGLIKHNIGLKKPRIAIRSLIKRSSKSLQALKPCFMMSPMSVAQYLEPGKFNFDLIVMDEASQIRPEDALGAIARGNSLVVVGDPKQLPPTSFFQKVIDKSYSEDSVAVEESESILESVIPMFKNRRLRWHYRSRHESLIAFSNHNFYDSNLVLFPSPFKESDEFGIRFHRVARGRNANRRNIEEARQIVATTAKQLISNPQETVGIVAMNSDQSDEIERQLEQAIKDDSILQKAYAKNALSGEGLFVKNLENVQGDERDVIIISMTYGPDKVGSSSMHQRFGPINSDVGWRRLNVLFTRSKKRMLIFSSMDSGHVRTSEKSSRGVKALKSFLHYCETGSLDHHVHTGKAPDSDFEISVMNALGEHGYECEAQLGVTGYFLDIAVKDPGMPGRFLMGIECDGASYHSAKSTRDRDRLRQEILEGLGWKIRRIWSTDWFKNPQAQLTPIIRELESLRTPENAVEAEDFLEIEEVHQEAEVISLETVIPMPNDLRTLLLNFDKETIRPKNQEIAKSKRLLRPDMLVALLSYLPCSKAEFREKIPSYLRIETDPKENKFLDAILQIIAENIDDEEEN